MPQDATRLPQPIALVLNYAALDFNFTSWMSPANLQVLQSEQSSGNLPGLHELASQKDHLQHIVNIYSLTRCQNHPHMSSIESSQYGEGQQIWHTP